MPKRSTTNIELKMIKVMMGILSAFERSSKGSPSGVVGAPMADVRIQKERGKER
jgi:hypothetical protein